MRKISIILVLIMLFSLFSSCDEDTQPRYEFSYEIEKTEYLRGEEIKIEATVKNISGKTQKCMGVFYPAIELYYMTAEGEVGGELNCEPIMVACDPVENTIKKNEIGSLTYIFQIPDDAVCGEYHVKLSWDGESRVFENVLRINAVTSQNENDAYNYSQISVSAGGESINPIRVGTSTEIQYADGTCAIGCDGLGVWKYFGEENTDLSAFPMLVLEDEPKLTLPENTRLEGIMVYDPDGNQIGGYYVSIQALEALPAGEYVVVIKAVYDTSTLSQTEYEITNYDDFFRLSIPKNAEVSEFNYSSVRIGCGGVEVIPIQTFLYSDYQKDDEVLAACGLGAAALFNDESFSPEDLPALTLKSNVVSYCPAGVTIGSAKVFDLDYNQLRPEMEYMWDFSKLTAGEYIIAFDEKVVDEYTTYGYESLFRLIVPENTVESFSFSTIREIYKAGDPGVKTEGFKNTSKQAVTTTAEASVRAKNECTIGYDTITVQYDAAEKVWSITFSTRGTLGGCQTVYVDENGLTLLIVYGE